MEVQGRSAIVTGGAGGLGAATVRRLVDSGVRVAVFDRDADRAGALAAELGDAAVAVSGDVVDDDAVAGAIAGMVGDGGASAIAVSWPKSTAVYDAPGVRPAPDRVTWSPAWSCTGSAEAPWTWW